jgi:hypothetical protein
MMTTLLELTKERLAYVTEKYGADGPIAKQLQMRLIALEESGNTESAFQAKSMYDDQEV